MTEFEIAQLGYQKLKETKFSLDKETIGVINEANDLFDSLEKGIESKGYLSWPTDLLLDFEFRLSRFAEFLGTRSSEADGEYTYFKDKLKQKYLKAYVENKRKLILESKEKVLKDEIEAETTEQLAEFQDKVNLLYQYSRYLKEYVDSIERYLLALTHRIKTLQNEESLSRK